MADDTPALSPATVVVHAGRPPREVDQPLNTPITMASTYVAGGDLEYGRYANPTWSAFEEALGALEGGRALAFSSGLAAVSTVLDLVGQDALVVAPRHAYLGSIGQLGDLESRGRIRVDARRHRRHRGRRRGPAQRRGAILWIESPTNPALEVADVETLVRAGHEAGARVVVDNTFATPLLQKPLELGADIVLHSVTKFLAGHSDIVMGALVVRDHALYDVLKGRRDLIGAIPGHARGVAGPAWPAHPAPAGRARAGQRGRARPSPRVAPGRRVGPLPGLRGHHLGRAADGRGRRPADPLHGPVGARHLARRRRVDVRAPPPLEGRGQDHPRGPRPDVRRHRGRRRPLGRPRRRPSTASPDSTPSRRICRPQDARVGASAGRAWQRSPTGRPVDLQMRRLATS